MPGTLPGRPLSGSTHRLCPSCHMRSTTNWAVSGSSWAMNSAHSCISCKAKRSQATVRFCLSGIDAPTCEGSLYLIFRSEITGISLAYAFLNGGDLPTFFFDIAAHGISYQPGPCPAPTACQRAWGVQGRAEPIPHQSMAGLMNAGIRPGRENGRSRREFP